MKKFIIKIVFFILPILIFPVLLKQVDSYIFKKTTTNLKGNILVLGDSHTQTGINDNLNIALDNLSQSSETYFFSYYKLKKIISQRKPAMIILGLSPHNLTFFQDEKTYGFNESTRFKALWERYYFSLNYEGIKTLNKNSSTNVYSITTNILNTNFKEILRGKNAYIGGFRKSEETNLDSILLNNKIKIHFYNNKNKVYKESQVQIEYLNKIYDLCKENDIIFNVINLPTHKLYKSKIPNEVLNTYDKIIKNLKNKGVTTLDYSLMDLPNNYFGMEII
ncbi:hypothetical protein QWY92_12250 [Algibacter miyuki]|uniref:hypothetical protein n=1 Tax=Algibacter miyuki TaxID=1306933 RepID=UPI0025B48AB7|nr:hypothetical protein [Algibacter miyuki]MDN3666174.1 hypothetical protein [Algibacter miyuki]